MSDSTVGLTIAVLGNSLIGVSYVVKKHGLNIMDHSTPVAYLKQPIWWLGLATMVLGEIGNFAAFAKAPAIQVTPMGALAVFVNALLSRLVLQEYISPKGYIGMVLCVVGTILIVLYAPAEHPIENVSEIETMMNHVAFKSYVVGVLATVTTMVTMEIKYATGTRYHLFYIFLCSVVGSMVVICIKGIGVAVVATASGRNQFNLLWANRLTYCFIVGMVICLVSQVFFLNRALEVWGASAVVPVLYVAYTSCTLIGTQCLYHNMHETSTFAWALVITGCLINFVGVLIVGKDISVPEDGKRKKLDTDTESTRGTQAGVESKSVLYRRAKLAPGLSDYTVV